MTRENQSSMSKFLLLGLPIRPEQQGVFFSLFLGVYRVATRVESGVLGFPSRRGLTPRGSLKCNPEIPAFPGEEY